MPIPTASKNLSLLVINGKFVKMKDAVCISVEGSLSLGLPKDVIVTQTNQDKVKVLARVHGKRHYAEQVLDISFKEMLRKEIIIGVKEIPQHLKRFYTKEVPAAALEPAQVESIA